MQKDKGQNNKEKSKQSNQKRKIKSIQKQKIKNNILNNAMAITKQNDLLQNEIKNQQIDMCKTKNEIQEKNKDLNEIEKILKDNIKYQEQLKQENSNLQLKVDQLRTQLLKYQQTQTQLQFAQKDLQSFQEEIKQLRGILSSHKIINAQTDLQGDLIYYQNQNKNYEELNEDNYLPKKCLDFLRDLQLKEVVITEQIIQYILFELNSFWKQREKQIINKAFVFCKNCKNKNLLQNNQIFLSSDLKQKNELIIQQQNIISNLQTRLKAQRSISTGKVFEQNFLKNQQIQNNLDLIKQYQQENQKLQNEIQYVKKHNRNLIENNQDYNLKEYYKQQGKTEQNKQINKQLNKLSREINQRRLHQSKEILNPHNKIPIEIQMQDFHLGNQIENLLDLIKKKSQQIPASQKLKLKEYVDLYLNKSEL